jgi:hypothetical protein
LLERDYQFCIIDPEGDYQNFEGAVVLGDVKHAPPVEEICNFLEKSTQSASANLLGVALEHRPAFFNELWPALLELRVRTDRPHWIVIDETHHLLPADWAQASLTLPQELHGLMLITVHPNEVAPAILAVVNTVIAIGETPAQTIGDFSKTIGQKPPKVPAGKLSPGEAIVWHRHSAAPPVRFRSIHPQAQRQGFMVHCCQKPLQRVACLRQAVYQAWLVACA